MNYIETQLKQALAKMLPEKLLFIPNAEIYEFELMWLRPDDNIPVLDTELLQLCWEVEEGLTNIEKLEYQNELYYFHDSESRVGHNFLFAHATWQQRVTALARVKGVKIV